MQKVKTKLACEIAGIDPARFNDAIHANLFPCAPETRPGSSRVFEVEDIIVIRIYRQLIDPASPQRFAAERAGSLACAIRERIGDPAVEIVSHVVGTAGIGKVVPRAVGVNDRVFGDASAVFSVTQYNIAGLRAEIMERLDYERQILGED